MTSSCLPFIFSASGLIQLSFSFVRPSDVFECILEPKPYFGRKYLTPQLPRLLHRLLNVISDSEKVKFDIYSEAECKYMVSSYKIFYMWTIPKIVTKINGFFSIGNQCEISLLLRKYDVFYSVVSLLC